MTREGSFAGLGIVVLALVAVAVPAWEALHGWEYAAALAVLMVLVVRGGFGRPPRAPVVALGLLVIGGTTLASGLLAPDSQIVTRVPGSVAVVPASGAAAFFPTADAASISDGSAHLVVRRRSGAPLVLSDSGLTYVGGNALEAVPHVAAYIEVRDPSGARLTITQPTSAAFLSPVTLFEQKIPVAGRKVPVDSFAVPALRREVKVFYFPAGSLPGLAHGGGASPSVLFAVDDEGGNPIPGSIAAARSGETITLAGLRLQATLGTYPGLRVSAIPFPPALWLGVGLLLGGLSLTARGRSPGGAAAKPESLVVRS